MLELITITDPADPRIAGYRDIRERDLVGREGRLIAEGEVVLRSLGQSADFAAESALIDPRRLEKLAPVLAALGPVPIYLAGGEVLKAIAGFDLHRGILALARRRRTPALGDVLGGKGRSLVMVLQGIANHDNMGGLFRNAAAFGVDGVLIDATSCDPLYRKATRVAVGATLTTPFVRLDPETDIPGVLAAAGYEVLALSPGGAETLADLAPSPRTAVLLGAEGPGLPADILARVRTVTIPMAPGFDSLNVAVTAGIVLHHLRFASGA